MVPMRTIVSGAIGTSDADAWAKESAPVNAAAGTRNVRRAIRRNVFRHDLPGRLMMADGWPRFGSSLLDRYIAIVDALLIHPFPTQPLFPGKHRGRSLRRRGPRRGAAGAILRGRRKNNEARKDREQEHRRFARQSHGRAPRSGKVETCFPKRS